MILHPSLTATTDREIELSIAISSAAINQVFLFDINGLGAGGTGRSIIVGPAGDVLHQSGVAEEMIPMEIDLQRVRRSREVGLRGLGQPLKSFRDRRVDFDLYRQPGGTDYLRSLGPLEKPQRGSRAGLPPRMPHEVTTAPEAQGFTVPALEASQLSPFASELPAGVSLPSTVPAQARDSEGE